MKEVLEIKLTKGAVTLVDADDYDWLSQWKWGLHPNGYAWRVAKVSEPEPRKSIMMHREIIKTPEGMFTDHINRNRLDNRKNNLRICSSAKNSFNRGKYENSTSKYRGVWWSSFYERWETQIYANRRRYYIGRFHSEIEAAKAYNKRAKELYGEFAGLNEVS